MTIRKALVLATIAALASLSAACGGGETPEAKAPDGTQAPEAKTPETPETPETPDPGAGGEKKDGDKPAAPEEKK